MKTFHSTFLLLMASSYQGQCQNCVRIALDAKRDGEPGAFWLARARFMAAEARSYLAMWATWTRLAA